MIHCVYIQFIAPLTVYLGPSFLCHVCCLRVMYSFYFAVFTEVAQAKDFRLCKKQ